MQHFTQLFTALDQTTKTLDKVRALADYFDRADDRDKMWAIALLSHRRPKRTVNTTLLGQWAASLAGLPAWLFEESYHVVGDLAETITLVLPPATQRLDETLSYWITYIKALEPLTPEQKQAQVLWAWDRLGHTERFIFNKLITGGFRMGVSQQLMIKALSKHTGVAENVLAHRLMGNWSTTDAFQQLFYSTDHADISKPYPFYLAYALEDAVDTLGAPQAWYAERKWDGIRGQIIVRQGNLFVWSRGEELVTAKYPEYAVLTQALPDGTVLDGEILPWQDYKPLPFALLQTRIGRKTLTAKILKDVPVSFMAYDVLEWQGEDVRMLPMTERRALLEKICEQAPPVLRLSPLVYFDSWAQLAEARLLSAEYHSEGIMLKRKESVYRDGRRRGDWWKWKVDPLTIDAVMIYAMRGHGRRANLYTDYTFAVWDRGQLVPFTKAYSGLTDEEIHAVDQWVKQHTVERFGPVRRVEPYYVFEIAFEGIARSSRHKSGVALRFPRIKRWRQDKTAAEANTLADLLALLKG